MLNLKVSCLAVKRKMAIQVINSQDVYKEIGAILGVDLSLYEKVEIKWEEGMPITITGTQKLHKGDEKISR